MSKPFARRLSRSALLFLTLVFSSVSCLKNDQPEFKFLDSTLSIDSRVDDLVSRMTIDEKISQMVNNAPAIERLGIPAYNWWSEGLHGVARAGLATVFPQAPARRGR